MKRVLSFKFAVFTFTPLLVLVLAAEVTVRVKYYLAHDYDWHYLTTPFPFGARSLSIAQEMPKQMRDALATPVISAQAAAAKPSSPAPVMVPAPVSVAAPSNVLESAAQHITTPSPTPQPPQEETKVAAPPVSQTVPSVAVPDTTTTAAVVELVQHATAEPAMVAPAGAPAVRTSPAPLSSVQRVPTPVPRPSSTLASPPAEKDRMVFLWPSPCVSGRVYSTERRSVMPRTWDANCFRGDHITGERNVDEFRVAFVGGSTVQDFQSDDEMMTAQFKRFFRRTPPGRRLVVVNAGHSGFDSRRILDDYRTRVSRFPVDAVVYYEGWNEQPSDAKPTRKADNIIASIHNSFHATLYHRSQLYTYLVEKYAFLAVSRAKFWKIEVTRLQDNFEALARDVRSRGSAFVFATQVIQFPRMWKGVDTFDYRAVNGLLERLKSDPSYTYDVTEVSALNQRLAVAYMLELCRRQGIPAINITEPLEALGDAGRAALFMDLGHLTVAGDRVVGELIAERMTVPN